MARRQLENKRCLVTGTSSGIGWHLALQLAAAGCQLVVTARREQRLKELSESVSKFGVTCIPVAGDITEPAVRGTACFCLC